MHRRKFIKTICVASTISTGLLVGCKSTSTLVQGVRKQNKLYIPLSEFTLTNTVSVAFESSAIGVTQHSDTEYTAVLLKCTHKGCTIAPNRSNKGIQNNENTSSNNNSNTVGFICPCHGAKFSINGKVLKGPAEKNLTQYITSSDNEFVVIHL